MCDTLRMLLQNLDEDTQRVIHTAPPVNKSAPAPVGRLVTSNPAALLSREGAMAWALSEVGESELGHRARVKRAVQVASAFVQSPSSSIPKACGEWKSTKAAYRFLSNREVFHDALLGGHVKRTAQRCLEHSVVLAVQDTTSLNFSGHRDGLGPVGDDWQGHGIFLHTTLAISCETLEVLGILAQHAWVRSAQKKPPKESSRDRRKRRRESEHWADGQRRVAEALQGQAPKPRVIGVFDREGDIFDAMEEMDRLGHSFVIRATRNRLLDDSNTAPDGERRYLLDEVKRAPVITHKTVDVPARAGRPGRTAVLQVRAMLAKIKPPKSRSRQGSPLELNIILALEINAPANIEPLCWYLVTREPIHSENAVLEVIRCYQARWLIEEFHKGLKTGCASEDRQLETAHALMNFLAIASVVAWQLLALRDAARNPKPILATALLSPLRLTVLNALKPRAVPPNATARDALRAIAKMGGFIGRKSDGEPGWLTLWRGFEKLLVAEMGYLAAKKENG